MAKSIKHPLDRPYRKYVAVFALLIIIISLPWFFPYQYYRYVKCGREPVKVVASVFTQNPPEYVTPASRYYNDYSPFEVKYYCSEQQAQEAGFTNKHPDN